MQDVMQQSIEEIKQKNYKNIKEVLLQNHVDYESFFNYVNQNSTLKFLTAKLYQYGIGVSKNTSRAVEIYEICARQDYNAYAQNQLGGMYILGNRINPNVPFAPNYEKAFEYYTLASQNNDFIEQKLAAYISIGLMYKHGRFVEKNIVKAIEYFSFAAFFLPQGDYKVRAQCLLGDYYCEYNNIELADYYYNLANYQYNNIDVMSKLGHMYFKHRYVKKHFVFTSFYYFKLITKSVDINSEEYEYAYYMLRLILKEYFLNIL